ncbi:hypothetical protein M9Y10_009768 [Tritrichomonas musculus]|uniref:VPS9 domain-containing protein n=1 Tax=Tritrichomonas musculus TaxID=1915356 RepID=A0ABR2IPF1_9EUKA
MNHNYLDILYQAIKNRAFQIECEVQLLHEQFFFIDNLKGIEDRIKRLIFFKYSTLDAIHTIYEYYLEIIQNYLTGPCPFKKAMQYHFTAICTLFNPGLIKSLQTEQTNKKDYYEKAQNCMITIQTNQEAIEELMGYNLYNSDDTVEKLIESLYFLFPYLQIITLISEDNKFFTNLIKIAYDYDSSVDKKVKSHFDCLKQVYQSFPSRWGNYSKQTILAISEVLLSIFTFQQDSQNVQTSIKCFEISERCKYLVKRNLEQLSIKHNFISIIEKNLAYSPPTISDSEELQKKEAASNSIKVTPLDYVDDSYSPIMCIHHVVLELRKLPLQPSISLKCLILMRTMNFLNSALCTEGKFVGADESFQFFVAGLADARLYHLPKILDQMKMFIVSDLTVGKISFLISQLECAIDFIETRILPVSPYILFPFKRDDIKYLHLVTHEELKNDNKDSNRNDKHQSNQTSNNPSTNITNSELKNDDNTSTTVTNSLGNTSNSKNDSNSSNTSKIANSYSYVDTNFYSDLNEEELILNGFKICAFPTFLRGKGQIPAVLLCTGDVRDRAIVYRYTLNPVENIANLFREDLGLSFQTYGCIHGNIYHMSKRSEYKGLIYIDHIQTDTENTDHDHNNNVMESGRIEDYNANIVDIAEFSNLMLMIPEPSSPSSSSTPVSKFLSTLPPTNICPEIRFRGYVAFPEMLLLSNLPRFKENFRIVWKPKSKSDNDKSTSDDRSTSSAKYYHQCLYKNSSDGTSTMNISSFPIIQDLQLKLIKAGKLGNDYDAEGIIDKETVYAIKSCRPAALNQYFVLTKTIHTDIKNILSGRTQKI